MKPFLTQYAGAEWVQLALKVELSPLGEIVANMLGELYRGIYHIEKAVRKTDWTRDDAIEIVLPDNEFATYDFGHLTKLVFLAHTTAIRVHVTACRHGLLKIYFHPRESPFAECFSQRHPALTQAVAKFIDGIPEQPAWDPADVITK